MDTVTRVQTFEIKTYISIYLSFFLSPPFFIYLSIYDNLFLSLTLFLFSSSNISLSLSLSLLSLAIYIYIYIYI